MHMQTTKRFISILLAAITLAALIAPSALAAVPAKVNADSVKVYQSASVTAIGVSVPKNTNVSITAISGGWAKVTYGSKTGYIQAKYLSPTKKVAGYAKSATAVYNSSGTKIGSISKAAGVYVLGTVGNYYCIANSSGTVGYVKSGTLSSTKPTVVTVTKATQISKVDKAIALGRSLLGTKYALSDTPPNSFNCSSFVRYCMKKAGYSMKGTAATQAADSRYQRITSISSLKKGDVLCFDTSENGKVDHSAIYLGNNKFIEASQKAGKVQINTLTDWYKKHFVCARRPA